MNVTGPPNSGDASSGSPGSEKDTATDISKGKDATKPALLQSNAPGQANMVTVGGPVTGLPLLRSSPIMHNTTKGSSGTSGGVKSTVVKDDSNENAKKSDANDSGTGVKKRRRKAKTVSWAPDNKLLKVEIIDNRIDLIKSWDPESQITLPFAPATLAHFQKAIAEAANPESLAASVAPGEGMDSFEVARQREHDVEQMRVREAKAELQGKLNAMKPMCNWLPGCMTVVLPPECRLDEDTIEEFSLGPVEEGGNVEIHPQSPPSPKRNENAPSSARASFAVNIPLHDTGAKIGNNDESMSPADSSVPPNAPRKDVVDMMTGVESGKKSRPNFKTRALRCGLSLQTRSMRIAEGIIVSREWVTESRTGCITVPRPAVEAPRAVVTGRTAASRSIRTTGRKSATAV